MIQRYRVTGLAADSATAVVKAVETLTMVDRALVDVEAGELVVEGEAEENAIRDVASAAGVALADRL